MSQSRPQPSPSFSCPPPTFTLNAPSRQVLTRKLAHNLLKPLNSHPYQTVILSGSAFGDGASTVVGQAFINLSRKQCLHTVILSDIITSLPVDEALRSLNSIASSIGSTYKRLRAVDLSHNPIGTLGIGYCAPLLENQNLLEVVNLEHTQLSSDAARLLCQYLTTNTPTNLRGLNVHGNALGSTGLRHIATVVANSPNLECLRVSSVDADASAVTAIAQALADKPCLRTLDLSNNGFDNTTAITMADALSNQSHLYRLSLSQLNLTNAALHSIVDAIESASARLIEFNLSGNQLTSEALPYLIQLLDADDSKLSVLDLSSNRIDDSGVRLIADAIARKAATSPLRKLLLAGNHITEVAAIHLAASLVQIPNLMRVGLSGNSISRNVAQRITAVFPPTTAICHDDGISEVDSNDDVETAVDDIDEGEDMTEGSSSTSARKTPRVSNADAIEMALCALETLANNLQAERSDLDESSSPQSQSEVSRLVSLFNNSEEASETTVDTNTKGSEETSEERERTVNDAEETSPPYLQSSSENRTAEIGTEDSVARTPPPTRTMRGMTSPVTPQGDVTGTGENIRVSVSRSSEEDGDVGSNANDDVMLSARKLKESIVSLSKEISDVAGELQMPAVSSTPLDERDIEARAEGHSEDEDNVNNYLLVSRENESEKPGSFSSFLVDCVGGCLVAMFVVILVLAIAQSQEEATFSYRQL